MRIGWVCLCLTAAPLLTTCRSLLAEDVSPRDAAPRETAARQNSENKSTVEATTFEIPEGTPAEIFQFINQVKRTPPAERSREAAMNHLRRQIDAVLAAADAILHQDVTDEDSLRAYQEKFNGLSVLSNIDPAAMESITVLAESLKEDPRPAVNRLAEFQLLLTGTKTSLTGSPQDRKNFVERLINFMDQHGIDRHVVRLAATIGEAVGRVDPHSAVSLLRRVGSDMEKSLDPQLQAQAPSILGTARRLNLPGRYMELSGVSADGKDFDWASYRGRFVLVDFWATWCGPCVAELPNVIRNLAKYGDRGFAVVGVNLDQNRADFDAFVEARAVSWENIMPDAGGNSAMAARYGITGIPTVILVDPDGKVVSMAARGPDLGRLLEQYLGSADTDGGND